MEIAGDGQFTESLPISLGDALVVSGTFEGCLTIQMALEGGGRWLNVAQTREPCRFENVASTKWRIRAGFLPKSYVAGTAVIELVPRPQKQDKTPKLAESEKPLLKSRRYSLR